VHEVANRAHTAVGVLVAGILALGLVAALTKSGDDSDAAEPDLGSALLSPRSATTERPTTTSTTTRASTTSTTERSTASSSTTSSSPTATVAGTQAGDPALALTGSSEATLASFGSLAISAGMLLVVVAAGTTTAPPRRRRRGRGSARLPMTRRDRRLARRRFGALRSRRHRRLRRARARHRA
jgi:hypothetical protein